MNRAGLPSHARQLRQIGDRRSACIHIAQTARRKPDSGLVASLQDPQRADPQRHDQSHAPSASGIESEKEDSEEDGGAERRESQSQAVSLTARADVWSSHSGLIYGGDPRNVHALHQEPERQCAFSQNRHGNNERR